jgi:hypothetical protein
MKESGIRDHSKDQAEMYKLNKNATIKTVYNT